MSTQLNNSLGYYANCIIITPHACARIKVVDSVVIVVIMDTKITKSEDLSNLAKNRLQFAYNRVAQPTSITNSAFMLAIIATLIGHAHYA